MKLTLCGSAKFESSFKTWNRVLTLQGHVVYSLAVYPSDMGDKNWYTEEQKIALDIAHKLKIANSDAIFVVNTEERYIGDSTISEIDYAFNLGKPVYWEFWPRDETIHRWYPHGNGVRSPDSLFKSICSYANCFNFLAPGVCAVCYE